jgi:hypothetical protein
MTRAHPHELAWLVILASIVLCIYVWWPVIAP